MLSIPDGQTTALAWKLGLLAELRFVAGRYIIAQSNTSILTFHMGTLLPCHAINLYHTLRQVRDHGAKLLQLGAGRHDLGMSCIGRTIHVNATHMAIQVDCSQECWVLIFEIRSGRLQASWRTPASYVLHSATWLAPAPFPVLSIQYSKFVNTHGPLNFFRSDVTETALHVASSQQMPLAHVHLEDEGGCEMLWPAPGRLLVLTLNQDQDSSPQLHMKDLNTGDSLYQCTLTTGELRFCELGASPPRPCPLQCTIH